MGWLYELEELSPRKTSETSTVAGTTEVSVKVFGKPCRNIKEREECTNSYQ